MSTRMEVRLRGHLASRCGRILHQPRAPRASCEPELSCVLTISSAPLTTPARTFENQSPPSLASPGNSTNSANGFSSNERLNSCIAPPAPAPAPVLDGPEGVVGPSDVPGERGLEALGPDVLRCVTVGVMLRNILKPTWAMGTGQLEIWDLYPLRIPSHRADSSALLATASA